jgi:hypothetical protein
VPLSVGAGLRRFGEVVGELAEDSLCGMLVVVGDEEGGGVFVVGVCGPNCLSPTGAVPQIKNDLVACRTRLVPIRLATRSNVDF